MLEVQRFLLEALCAVDEDSADRTAISRMPGWLARALETARHDGDVLAGGAAALARSAGRSLDHLNRTCRRYLGATASSVVNRLRIERAEHLLQSTPLDITDIAFESGFSSLSYFYRVFRAHAGVTPAAFRDSHVQPVFPAPGSRYNG
jgi:AraC family cel operon transcriptional repressor